MVVEQQLGPEGMRQAEAFFRRARIIIEPVTVEQGELARQAFLDFGKGGHRAGSTLATASPMPSRRRPVNPSCSRVTTSARPTSWRRDAASRVQPHPAILDSSKSRNWGARETNAPACSQPQEERCAEALGDVLDLRPCSQRGFEPLVWSRFISPSHRAGTAELLHQLLPRALAVGGGITDRRMRRAP